MTGTNCKPGALAQAIEAAGRRVDGLEYSLRIYRDHSAAAVRIAEQLDEAYLDLSRLEQQVER